MRRCKRAYTFGHSSPCRQRHAKHRGTMTAHGLCWLRTRPRHPPCQKRTSLVLFMPADSSSAHLVSTASASRHPMLSLAPLRGQTLRLSRSRSLTGTGALLFPELMPSRKTCGSLTSLVTRMHSKRLCCRDLASNDVPLGISPRP